MNPCSETANITSEPGAKPSPKESPKSAADSIGGRYLLTRRERADLVLQTGLIAPACSVAELPVTD
jgi:hypothetical protein